MGSLISTAIAQVSIFFSYTSLSFGLTKVAPEGLLLPLTLLLSAALVEPLFLRRRPNPGKQA
jgi:hypothetical protein